jgi:hypothetical protein
MRPIRASAWLAAGLVLIGPGIAGCRPAGGSASSAPPSVAAASATAPATSAAAASSAAAPVSQTGETPAQFVTRLFTSYQPGGQQWADAETPAAEKAQKAYQAQFNADFYDADFLKLMNDNGALAGKNGGGADLDYDPICQCQDGGAHFSYVSGQPNGQFFNAKVTSDNGQKPWLLVLTDTPKGWRVYSVIDESGDVRAWLTKHNACLRAAKTEAEQGKCIT